MNRRILMVVYVIALAVAAVAVFFPWMSWNNGGLIYYGYQNFWSKILLLVVPVGILIALFGPAIMLADQSPRGTLSRLTMSIFGLGVIVLALAIQHGAVQFFAYPVPHVIGQGFIAAMCGGVIATLAGSLVDWAGRGNVDPSEPDTDVETVEKTPIVPISGEHRKLSFRRAAVVDAESETSVATLVEPLGGARQRAEQRVEQETSALETAFAAGEISDIEYAARKLSLGSKTDEYELCYLIEAKIQSLRNAMSMGQLDETRYEAKIGELRAAIRKAVGRTT